MLKVDKINFFWKLIKTNLDDPIIVAMLIVLSNLR